MIIVAIIVVAGIGFGIYFYMTNANGNATVTTTGVSAASSTGNEITLPASQALSGTPTSTLLTLGTANGSVQVNNFYLSDPMVTDGGETVILASSTDYLVTYDTMDSSFWIGVDPGQFTTARPVAEQALLSVLGVSSTAACKLNISVGTFYSASSSLNGQSFTPSFCSGFNTTP